MTTESIQQADRPPFEVIPFSGGAWKVLDWKRGRYIRRYDSLSAARRYAGSRNRKAGFSARAVIRNAPAIDTPAPPLMSDASFNGLLERYRRALEARTS